ncbi:hypothetical protein L484_014702 [Morus notabilis]|uniref:Uncharacterized protein n=1 Tax=Morus notabilis TaxID=981085 RepID=W9SM87_9ROSA|nr:hypothetical protein L484_014702 [Morus notabilis]
MQFKKDVKRQKPTYITITDILKKGGREPIPPPIKVVLKKFGDVMPDKLLKTLPPRGSVQYKIELVLKMFGLWI